MVRMYRILMYACVNNGDRGNIGGSQRFGKECARLVMQRRRFLWTEAQPRLLLPTDKPMIVHRSGAGTHDRCLAVLPEGAVVGPQGAADEIYAHQLHRGIR